MVRFLQELRFEEFYEDALFALELQPVSGDREYAPDILSNYEIKLDQTIVPAYYPRIPAVKQLILDMEKALQPQFVSLLLCFEVQSHFL
jgi:hypothetical protein